MKIFRFIFLLIILIFSTEVYSQTFKITKIEDSSIPEKYQKKHKLDWIGVTLVLEESENLIKVYTLIENDKDIMIFNKMDRTKYILKQKDKYAILSLNLWFNYIRGGKIEAYDNHNRSIGYIIFERK